MDEHIDLIPTKQKPRYSRDAILSLLIRLRLTLKRFFLQRIQTYILFFVSFLLFSYFGAVYSRSNPFFFRVVLIDNFNFVRALIFISCILLFASSFTLYGAVVSFLFNAFVSFFVGLNYCSTISLTLFFTFAAFISIIISAEIFKRSFECSKGKFTSHKRRFTAAIFDLILLLFLYITFFLILNFI